MGEPMRSRSGSIVVVEGEEDKVKKVADGKVNVALQKKIASNTEAAIILEG